MISLCQEFGFPVSWRKLQLGAAVEWIGWQLHFHAAALCSPAVKVQKLLDAIRAVRTIGPRAASRVQGAEGMWVLL